MITPFSGAGVRHPSLQAEIQFALDAVRQAALLVRQVQAEMVSPALTKGDRSPVTVADFASQALVGHLLEQAFPGDALVAEEDADALRVSEGKSVLQQVTGFVRRALLAAPQTKAFFPGDEAGLGKLVCDWIDRGGAEPGRRFWTLDPIDGTKGFLRGEQYVVALALIEDGQVQVGVLGCPNLSDAGRPDMNGAGSLVAAVRGQGAWTASLTQPDGFQALHVSPKGEPPQARILRSVERAHTNLDQIDEFARALGVQAAPVSMDSQAKYALLAAGQGDLYLRLLSPEKPDYREKIWDQAAGSLIIEEAGGQVTDLYGKMLDFTTGRSLTNNRGILASNRLLHPAALAALSSVVGQ